LRLPNWLFTPSETAGKAHTFPGLLSILYEKASCEILGQDESGATATEYGLMAADISIAIGAMV
jgi:hypothetical protein